MYLDVPLRGPPDPPHSGRSSPAPAWDEEPDSPAVLSSVDPAWDAPRPSGEAARPSGDDPSPMWAQSADPCRTPLPTRALRNTSLAPVAQDLLSADISDGSSPTVENLSDELFGVLPLRDLELPQSKNPPRPPRPSLPAGSLAGAVGSSSSRSPAGAVPRSSSIMFISPSQRQAQVCLWRGVWDEATGGGTRNAQKRGTPGSLQPDATTAAASVFLGEVPAAKTPTGTPRESGSVCGSLGCRRISDGVGRGISRRDFLRCRILRISNLCKISHTIFMPLREIVLCRKLAKLLLAQLPLPHAQHP